MKINLHLSTINKLLQVTAYDHSSVLDAYIIFNSGVLSKEAKSMYWNGKIRHMEIDYYL